MGFKSKFPRDILNEVKWKEGCDLSKCTIYYINRGSPNDIGIVSGSQIIEIGGFLILEGDPYESYIPYHRILKIEYDDMVIFDRKQLKTINDGQED